MDYVATQLANIATLYYFWAFCDECQEKRYVCPVHQQHIEPILKEAGAIIGDVVKGFQLQDRLTKF